MIKCSSLLNESNSYDFLAGFYSFQGSSGTDRRFARVYGSHFSEKCEPLHDKLQRYLIAITATLPVLNEFVFVLTYEICELINFFSAPRAQCRPPCPALFDELLLLDCERMFVGPPFAFFMTCSDSQLSYWAFERIGCPLALLPLSPTAELIISDLITPPTAA